MVFNNCSFDECRKCGFACSECSHFDKDGVSDCVDPIHPILGIPISLVSFDGHFVPFEGTLLPVIQQDIVLDSEPVQLEFDFK